MFTPNQLVECFRKNLEDEQRKLSIKTTITLEQVLEKAGIDEDRLETWEKNETYPGKCLMLMMANAKKELMGAKAT